MKRTGILNADLSRLIAALGHGDAVVIGDAGLPVPSGVPCIDLAVTVGVPRFAEVLAAVLSEMAVEHAVMAVEAGPEVRGWLAALSPEEVPHEALKARTASARAVIRTGEGTPYANVVLLSGVVF